MKTALPYFSHDNDARNHPKIKALRGAYGVAGIGLFWMLNEMIASSDGARLDVGKKVNRLAAAAELGLDEAGFAAFLAFLSDPDIDLINLDDGIVTTDRTTEDFEKVHRSRSRDQSRKAKSPKQDRQDASPGKEEEQPERADPDCLSEAQAPAEPQESSDVQPEKQKHDQKRQQFITSLYQTLTEADGFFIPGEARNFEAIFPLEVEPYILGIEESAILEAVRNLSRVASAPPGTFFWDRKVSVKTFFERHLARFLPGQFKEEDFRIFPAKRSRFSDRKPAADRPEMRYPPMQAPQEVSEEERKAVDATSGGNWLETFRKATKKAGAAT